MIFALENKLSSIIKNMNIFENGTLVERVESLKDELKNCWEKIFVEYSLIEVRSIENFVVFLVIIQDRVWFFESCGKYFRPNFSTISWKFWKTISRNPIWIHEIFEFSNFPVIREIRANNLSRYFWKWKHDSDFYY